MLRTIDPFEMNVLIGSILGDGSLAKYGRSKNAYYREHGCVSQSEYRAWKADKLSISFLKETNAIRSRSLPIYTFLHQMFYKNNIKTITKDNIKFLNHPVGLMCLYFDDGSLVIDSYNKKNGKHVFPRIFLYTQSYSKSENVILLEHIKKHFGITFKLKKIPNGSGWCLEINKRNDIVDFLNLIKPYTKNIPCMSYKVNLKVRLNAYYSKHPDVILDTLNVRDNSYSKDDIILLTQLYKNGVTQMEISRILKRSYYGVVDKIRRLKKENKL